MASFDVLFWPGAVAGSAVQAGAGAVTCQAQTRPGFGEKVLERLKAGRPAAEALDGALEGEATREHFQVCVVDTEGQAAAFTGNNTMEWRGHLTGQHCAAAGNILAGEAVVTTMVSAFETQDGLELAERLLTALEAGYAAGGDRRGSRMATLWLGREDLPLGGLSVRVQEHAEPLVELRRLLGVAKREMDFMATAIEAGRILLPLVDPEDILRRMGALTTMEAVDQLRRELAQALAPTEALQLLERVAWQLREVRPDMAAIPFRLVVPALQVGLDTYTGPPRGD